MAVGNGKTMRWQRFAFGSLLVVGAHILNYHGTVDASNWALVTTIAAAGFFGTKAIEHWGPLKGIRDPGGNPLTKE
jgi:hypothetical protein